MSGLHIESVAGDVRGERALGHLIDPGLAKDSELVLFMASLSHADAFTGAVLRVDCEEHLGAVADGTVTVSPPTDDDAWAFIHDALGPLPERCSIPHDVQAPIRDRRVFLPAVRVDDLETAALLSGYIRAGGGASAGLSVVETRYLAKALIIVADNGLQHGGGSCGTVICGAVEPQTRAAQLVAIDLGTSISGAADPSAELRRCVDGARRRFGGLRHLADLAAQASLDVSVTIASGTARSRWGAADRQWHHDAAAFAPGFTVGISISSANRSTPRPVAPTNSASAPPTPKPDR